MVFLELVCSVVQGGFDQVDFEERVVVWDWNTIVVEPAVVGHMQLRGMDYYRDFVAVVGYIGGSIFGVDVVDVVLSYLAVALVVASGAYLLRLDGPFRLQPYCFELVG